MNKTKIMTCLAILVVASMLSVPVFSSASFISTSEGSDDTESTKDDERKDDSGNEVSGGIMSLLNGIFAGNGEKLNADNAIKSKDKIDEEITVESGTTISIGSTGAGQKVSFTGEGKYVFQTGSALLLQDNTQLTGVGKVIFEFKEGSTLYLGNSQIPLTFPEDMELSLEKSVSIKIGKTGSSSTIMDMKIDVDLGSDANIASGDIKIEGRDGNEFSVFFFVKSSGEMTFGLTIKSMKVTYTSEDETSEFSISNLSVNAVIAGFGINDEKVPSFNGDIKADSIYVSTSNEEGKTKIDVKNLSVKATFDEKSSQMFVVNVDDISVDSKKSEGKIDTIKISTGKISFTIDTASLNSEFDIGSIKDVVLKNASLNIKYVNKDVAYVALFDAKLESVVVDEEREFILKAGKMVIDARTLELKLTVSKDATLEIKGTSNFEKLDINTGGKVSGVAAFGEEALFIYGDEYNLEVNDERSVGYTMYVDFNNKMVPTLISDKGYKAIEPYDEKSGGVKYEINADGHGIITEKKGKVIANAVGMDFTYTYINSAPVTVKCGAEVKLQAPADKEGYYFIGWNDGTEFIDNDETEYTMPARNVVMNEVWSKDIDDDKDIEEMDDELDVNGKDSPGVVLKGSSVTNLSDKMTGKPALKYTSFNTKNANIKMDAATMAALSGKDMELSAELITEVTDEMAKVVGNSPVYSISLKSGGVVTSELGGKALVSVLYTLKDGESAEDVKMFYLDQNGRLTKMITTFAVTDVKNVIELTFETPHFSNYTAMSSDKSNNNSMSTTTIIAIAAVVAVALLVTAVVLIKRRA